MQNRIRVCHVTSAHMPFDGRIFERECVSLAKLYDVYLIVPNIEDCERNCVHVLGVNMPTHRLSRQFHLKDIYKRMIEVDADIYHFHEPELIPYGLKIKKHGKKVIFDSHENVPVQILKMSYIPNFFRGIASKLYKFYESYSLKKFDSLISVNEEIVSRLKEINPNTWMITNFPVIKENGFERKWERKIGFAGTIAPCWEIHNILKAIEPLDVSFEMAGPVSDSYLSELKELPAWEKVNYYGVIRHEEVFPMLSKCTIGMAIGADNDPNGNMKEGTLGVTKLFEYMGVGIPVLASDLTLWVSIIEGGNCGCCVNCNDVEAIREKVLFLLDNLEEAKMMGDNGKKLAEESYSWESQENELFKLYSNL